MTLIVPDTRAGQLLLAAFVRAHPGAVFELASDGSALIALTDLTDLTDPDGGPTESPNNFIRLGEIPNRTGNG